MSSILSTPKPPEALRSALANLPAWEREDFLASLNTEEIMALAYDWYGVWARAKQHPPPGAWFIWMVMTGRGWGKTRTGGEWVRHRVETGQAKRIALVARTKADIRDVLVEGKSGLMNLCPHAGTYGKGPIYESSKRRITWPNGAMATLYSADEPDQLRGPEHDTAWCDELASWRRPDAWDNLMFGLRSGDDPRCVITTTPKRVALVRKILARSGIVITTGSTYENLDNLAEQFVAEVTSNYEGTRLGLQELHGQLLDDNPDALWKFTEIEEHRAARAPRQFRRIVVAVDPEATDTEESAETGIIVAGRGYDNHLYILDDLTIKGTPHVWGRAVAQAYRKWEANLVVGEVNNGGDMVGFVIQQFDANIAYKSVRASRGKLTRAEPISTIYEKGYAHHVGTFPDLEGQMCNWIPGEKSPDRMDALVWAGHELMLTSLFAGRPAVGTPHTLGEGYRYE